MKDLSIIQEYVICSVNEKGKIPGFSVEKRVCFVAAGILELQLENCIFIEGKKVTIIHQLPAALPYLRPLYDSINQKKTAKLNKILEEFCFGFTDKQWNELMNAVGDSLVNIGVAQENAGGVLGNKKNYIPDSKAVRCIVDNMRAELLEEGKITEETAALAVLLERSRCLKTYFSKYEQKEMKHKLQKILDSPEGKLVKEMVDYIKTILAAVSVSASASV